MPDNLASLQVPQALAQALLIPSSNIGNQKGCWVHAVKNIAKVLTVVILLTAVATVLILAT